MLRIARIFFLLLATSLLAVSVSYLAAASALRFIYGARFSNTCDLTQEFGSRTSLCSLQTGWPLFDERMHFALSTLDPVLFWALTSALALLLIWLACLPGRRSPVI